MPSDNPPPLVQLDPQALQAMALEADRAGFTRSDTDYARRFPNLVNARNYTINNAVSNLNGATDPMVAGALKTTGLAGVNLGNEYQKARNLGQPIASAENRDRNYFQRLLSENPARTFGLSGGDQARIAAVNAGTKLNFDWANFGSKINAQQAAQANQAASSQALISGIGGVAKSLGSLFTPRSNNASDPYLTSNYYSGGYNPAYAGSMYGQGYASYNLPVTDPDYGNANYIGLGDTGTSGTAGTYTGGGSAGGGL